MQQNFQDLEVDDASNFIEEARKDSREEEDNYKDQDKSGWVSETSYHSLEGIVWTTEWEFS